MGFQRQLVEFEKLLHLKKSYSSPNRVDKLTQKVIVGNANNYHSSKINKNNDQMLLKELTRSLVKGPNGTTAKLFNPNATTNDQFFDREVPQQDEYQRVNFFDRSNAFGFSEDKLGRLAEINKTQMQSALRDLSQFTRTDAGFNRQIYNKGNVSTHHSRIGTIYESKY